MKGTAEATELALFPEKTEKKEPLWESTSVTNLVRRKASGVYFARARVNGKLIWKSLETTLFSVAKNRLPGILEAERERTEGLSRVASGKMMFGDASKIYLERLDADPALKPRSRDYRRECLKAIVKTWPGIESTDVRKITKSACAEWAARFRAKGTEFRPIGSLKPHVGVSPTRFNNTVATLRMILGIPVEMGALHRNPVADIKRAKARNTDLQLPSRSQFVEFVKLIESSGAGQSKDCADLVRGLAFSGCRISEANRLTWTDINWQKEEIVVRGDPETGTKNWEIRHVPMIPELKSLLERMRQQRPGEPIATPVFRVRECQKSMDRAARLLGIERITHHDLRHLYATTAIESGIDIPTVSRLLGHKDGGVLAMRTYGHLRQEHAKAAVQKIRFAVNNSSC